MSGLTLFMTEVHTVATTVSERRFSHLGDIETAETYLKKFREQHPEITNLEEYKKVAPSICLDYLIEGLTPIWAD